MNPSHRRPRSLVITLAAVTTAATVLLAGPTMAGPPGAPTLVGPSDGSTTPTTAPTLSVVATDPDGGAVPVRFEGRKLGATTPTPGTGDPFTMVALPDTQNYTYSGRQGTILQQTNWVVDSRTALGTAFVVQLGDLVSDWFKPQQWQYISDGLKVLDDAGVPNSVVPGNHDFDNVAQDVGPYDTWFPVSRYANASWNSATTRYGGYLGQNQFGPDPVDRRNTDNYALFTAGGRDFLVLNLEWEAPQYALDWADRVLAAFPDRVAIMVTHSFVNVAGGRMTTPQRSGGTSTARLWSEFVSEHCSIRLVLSGHEHNGDAGEARRTDANSCGNPVQQILTDYQARANGGDGWLRYYTFDPAANTLRATTYSPKLGVYETDADSSFTLPFDLGVATPAPFSTIGTTIVSSGQTASIRWTGLDRDTRYEWRAIAGDGTEIATSPTWTLRTPAAAGDVTDTFTRAATGTWGNADSGQRWSSVPSSAFSVDGSRGRVSVPAGTTRRAQLDDVSLRDVLISTDVSLSARSAVYFTLQGRSSSSGQYRAKLKFLAAGTATISVARVLNGIETTLAAERTIGTFAAGVPVVVRLELTGAAPTTVRAQAWSSTAPEPTGWTVSATDSTPALQAAGTIGFDTYLSSSATAPVTIAMDNFVAAESGTPPPPVNQPPTAVIDTPAVTERAVSVSGANSTDPDGTIAGWSWNFGDGGTATGRTAGHTYTADGSYPITLTVTDDKGATATATRTVTVAATPPPVNQPPTAVIDTPAVTERAVSVTGANSTDPDGSIAGWSWNFGDGGTATGRTAGHTYTADGRYPITLTVTDDKGATATATRTVTVAATPPPVTEVAADTFSRTVSRAWGPAATGGNWTTTGSADRFGVAVGVGRQTTAPGQSAEANLTAVRATSAQLDAAISWDRQASEGRLYSTFVVRAVSTGSYRLAVNVEPTGAPRLSLIRRIGTTETTLAVAAVSGTPVTAGTWYRVSIRAVPGAGGSTVLSAKVWPRGGAEPAAAQVTATDGTAALQMAGWVGLGSYRSSGVSTPVTTSFDDLRVVPIG